MQITRPGFVSKLNHLKARPLPRACRKAFLLLHFIWPRNWKSPQTPYTFAQAGFTLKHINRHTYRQTRKQAEVLSGWKWASNTSSEMLFQACLGQVRYGICKRASESLFLAFEIMPLCFLQHILLPSKVIPEYNRSYGTRGWSFESWSRKKRRLSDRKQVCFKERNTSIKDESIGSCPNWCSVRCSFVGRKTCSDKRNYIKFVL